MKRPVGVILSCIVLGLLAALQLLTAAGMAFASVLMKRGIPTPSGNTPTGGPPAGFVVVVVVAMAFFMLLLAGWSIATLVGLAGLRNWARYSVLVIGGCMAGFGTLAILGIVMAATVMPQAAPTPNVPAHTMQVIFAIYGFLYAIVVAIGVWWLVYFNQRATKAYFLPHYAADPALYPPAYPGSYPPPYAGAPPPLPYIPPAKSTRAPTSIIVLACLYFLVSLGCLLYAFLPLPLFAFGFLVHGAAVPVIYLAMTVLTGLIGWGLIKLDNRARIAAFASLILGVINMIILLLPWGRAQLVRYSAELNARMGVPQSQQVSFLTGPVMIVSAIFGLTVYAGIAWILQHNRYAFTGETPPPPDPLETPLIL